MKRRTFLYMPLLGLFSSVTFSKSGVSVTSLDSHTREAFSGLSTMFADRLSAAAIGKEYLSHHPYLDNPEQLLSNLGINVALTNHENMSLFEKTKIGRLSA